MGNDLARDELYESVRTLVETEGERLIHLSQHKLFTLFSIAFQYLLFQSTKNPGSYIIRVEDSSLAEKLAKRAKDPSSRKFLQSLLIPRKLKYGQSLFYLDFFHFGSWNLTCEIPKEKARVAIVIKNSSVRPLLDSPQLLPSNFSNESGEEGNDAPPGVNFPENYFLTSLQDFVPKTIAIAFEQDLEGYKKITFPFIRQEEKTISGVTLAKDLKWDEID